MIWRRGLLQKFDRLMIKVLGWEDRLKKIDLQYPKTFLTKSLSAFKRWDY